MLQSKDNDIKMNENIKAGADIHAGDGGYSEGTKEKYEAFAKIRNESLSKSRFKEHSELAKEYALDAMIKITDKEEALKVYAESYDRKFAELIVRECARIADMVSENKVEWVGGNILVYFGLKE